MLCSRVKGRWWVRSNCGGSPLGTSLGRLMNDAPLLAALRELGGLLSAVDMPQGVIETFPSLSDLQTQLFTTVFVQEFATGTADLVPHLEPTDLLLSNLGAFGGDWLSARAFSTLNLRPPRRPKATAAGSLPCSSGVGGLSSTCPEAMSIIILHDWLGSRGRLRCIVTTGPYGRLLSVK